MKVVGNLDKRDFRGCMGSKPNLRRLRKTGRQRGDIKYRHSYKEFAMRCAKERLVANE